jgi:hypothetical protein
MTEVPPLFMFGFERSGTTFLSMLVGAHPEIAVPLSTTGLWYHYAGKIAEYSGLADQDSVERMVQDLLGEKRVQMWDADLIAGDLLPDIRIADYPSVVSAFHKAYAAKQEKPCWANIDIASLYSMDTANDWFPNAKFLHIVRDGRDVALSHVTYRYGLSTTTEVADHWVRDLHTNMKMGRIIGPERYKIIRYEDLVNDTETLLREICEFIGVRYSEEMLAYPQMVESKIPPDRRFLWPALNKPPQAANSYRWKTGMSKVKRNVFESHAIDMLKQLGYETFDSVPTTASAYLYDFWCYIGSGGRIKRLKEKLPFGKTGDL